MTVEEARTIWLTLLGSEPHTYFDVMTHPQYAEILSSAYKVLRENNEVSINTNTETIKIKCKS
jgi:hypothetical protein